MINNDNIELYIFQLKEGMLGSEEAETVRRALEENSEWAMLAAAYDPTLQLPKEAPLPYPNKEKLRRIAESSTGRKRVQPLWRRMAAAACLLLAVGLGVRLLWPHEETEEIGMIAETVTAAPEKEVEPMLDTQAIEQPVTPIAVDNEPVLLADAEVPQPEAPQEELHKATKEVLITNRLITYLDDVEETRAPAVVLSEKLITYLDDELQAGGEAEWEPSNLQYAFQDVRNSMQLMYTEQRTNLINWFLNNDKQLSIK